MGELITYDFRRTRPHQSLVTAINRHAAGLSIEELIDDCREKVQTGRMKMQSPDVDCALDILLTLMGGEGKAAMNRNKTAHLVRDLCVHQRDIFTPKHVSRMIRDMGGERSPDLSVVFLLCNGLECLSRQDASCLDDDHREGLKALAHIQPHLKNNIEDIFLVLGRSVESPAYQAWIPS